MSIAEESQESIDTYTLLVETIDRVERALVLYESKDRTCIGVAREARETIQRFMDRLCTSNDDMRHTWDWDYDPPWCTACPMVRNRDVFGDPTSFSPSKGP